MFDGAGGNDFIDGNGGFDRVRYDFLSTGATGIDIDLGRGIVTGRDPAATAVVGTDTLRSIESVRGSQSADNYDASNFTATGDGVTFLNFGGAGPGPLNQGNFNEFEGLGGDDTIKGNGNTRVAYYSATSGVNITFTAAGVGTASGDASVGTDTFTAGVSQVRGSNYNDTFTGYNNGTATFEQFEGWAGNDTINGGAGLDLARYDGNNGDASGVPMGANGMTFNMAAGQAFATDGIGSNADFNYGSDTLLSVEAIRGTNSNDIYNAAGFSTSSTNAASYQFYLDLGAFNQFEGGGGDDVITGNNATRVSYQNAGITNGANGSGLIITLKNGAIDGFATGRLNNTNATTANSSIGVDVLKDGINAIRGSNGNDIITGSDNTNPDSTELFEGMGGNDTINGLGGNDLVRYDNHATGGIGVNIVRNSVDTTVTRLSPNASDGVGTDKLFSIEAIRGTQFADTYNATGFSGFNQFEGLGGNDDITGNGNTRISYLNAPGNVFVDLAAGTTNGFAGQDVLHGGINAVRGSQYNDDIRGSSGNDTLTGHTGSDTFRFIDTNFGHDTITDFHAGIGTDDVLLFDDTVFANYDAVIAAATQDGLDTVITLNANNSIRLTGVIKADLHVTDFFFT